MDVMCLRLQLVEVLTEMAPEQQRAFLQFVTGAPRLPLGGLSALSPPLTIVCKVVNSLLHPFGSSLLLFSLCLMFLFLCSVC